MGRASLALLLISAAIPAESTLRIPARVVGPSELPVTGGIPLPSGRLRPGEPMRARAAGGRTLRVQARPLALWPDGSVRWLLADVDPAGRRDLIFEIGEPLESGGAGARAALTAEGIAIGTGSSSCLVPATGGILPRRLRLGALGVDGAGGLDVIAEVDGEALSLEATAAEKLEIERAEGVRVAATAEGSIRAASGATIVRARSRIEGFAGRALYRVAVQFVAGDASVRFDRLRLVLGPRPGPHGAVRFAFPGRSGGGPLSQGEDWELSQGSPEPFALRHSGLSLKDGQQAPGWVAVLAEGRAASVSVARFAEMGPGSIRASLQEGVEIDLAPPGYELRAGSALRRDLVIALASAEAAMAGPSALLPDADRFPALVVSPAWIAESKAAGPLTAASDRTIAEYDRLANRLLDEHAAERRRLRLFGPRDFGDWPMGRGFGNLEFDTGLGFLLGFLRTGDARWLDEARVALRHLRDADVRWSDGRPSLPRVHGADHGEHSQLDHVWLEGLLLEWALSGDPWALEAACGFRDAIVSSFAEDADRSFRVDEGPRGSSPAPTLVAPEREVAWSLLSTIAAEALAPETGLGSLRRSLVSALLDAEAGRGFLSPVPKREAESGSEDPSGRARRRSIRVNPWITLGITVEALCRAHEIEPREEVRQAIQRIASTVADHAFEPKTRAIAGGLFFDPTRQEDPARSRPVSPDAALFAARGLAHAARITGSGEMLLLARDVAGSAMRASLEKSSSLGGRERTRALVSGPSLLAYLRRD